MSEKSYREGNNLFEKGYLYLKQYGISKTALKIKNKFFKQKQQIVEYGEFLRNHTPDESELALQRREVFAKRPLISIVIPMYQTNEVYLCELLDTVMNQTYDNWELCLADASDSDALKEVIEDHCGSLVGSKIKYRHLEKNLGISGNTNAAIDMAEGDYIAFSDHDDTLSVTALYEVVKAINEADYDCIYSDEDKLDAIADLPFTVLFLDGNHECFPKIYSYPEEVWNGGKIHRVRQNIYHLMRGQVFEINGISSFTMGGGYSIDKIYRIPGRSWWPEEMPTQEEYKEAWDNLSKHDNRVDLIISH